MSSCRNRASTRKNGVVTNYGSRFNERLFREKNVTGKCKGSKTSDEEAARNGGFCSRWLDKSAVRNLRNTLVASNG